MRKPTPPDQLGLFGGATPAAPVGPAPISDEDRALADALPGNIRLGTSSWSFPGWSGIVYDRKTSEKVLARHGLAAYAANPLFRTVGVDRSHYQPLSVETWQHYASQVPEDFRFLVKAHEASTLWGWPKHARYGKRRGQQNPDFLDPEYATREVVAPTVEGLGDKLGVLLFQFAAQDLQPIGGVNTFCDRLFAFLNGLPKGPTYAVEIRNPQLLVPRFAEALAAGGAMPCLNGIGAMPSLNVQYRQTPAAIAPVTVMRWLLRRDHTYKSAVGAFQPFDALKAPDAGVRETIAEILKNAGRESYCIINNKAEGSSPLSVRALARQILR